MVPLWLFEFGALMHQIIRTTFMQINFVILARIVDLAMIKCPIWRQSFIESVLSVISSEIKLFIILVLVPKFILGVLYGKVLMLIILILKDSAYKHKILQSNLYSKYFLHMICYWFCVCGSFILTTSYKILLNRI